MHGIIANEFILEILQNILGKLWRF